MFSQSLWMMALGLVALTAVFLAAASADDRATVGDALFYVATNGNDAWSGKLPAPNEAK